MHRLGETDEDIPCHRDDHLSRLWRRGDRTNAHRCLPVSLHCGYCGVTLRPRPGDCCVFCSYGNVPCPPKQAERGA